MNTAVKQPFYQSAFAVFLLAFLIRLGFAADGLMKNDEERFVRPDTAGYEAPAKSLAERGIYCGPEGKVTAHRTPGFPMFLAAVGQSGGRRSISILLILLGSIAVFPVHAACRRFASPGAASLAALLFALNPTAIAHAPLILSDTLFMLFSAFSILFFSMFLSDGGSPLPGGTGKKHDFFYLAYAVLFAGLGVLIRPVNLFWFLPCGLVLVFTPGLTVRTKVIAIATSVLLFTVLWFPWVVRNAGIGSGWRIDASSAVTMQHNASALESVLTGKSGEEIRAQYQEEMRTDEMRFPEKFETEAGRLSYVERKMTKIILAHPFRYALLCMRPYTLLPDVPTLLENCNITAGGRGTFDVLNRQGFAAAVRHYFAGHGEWLFILLPLLLAAVLLYSLAAAGAVLFAVKRDWSAFLLCVCLGLYYPLMTGPVTMPRYILPSLPLFCICAAVAWDALLNKMKSWKNVEKQTV